jgi:demethylmenaquinone methyltransferase/2-methoxy-6-polyprenyl-1,4-benzoquinol methylase
MFDRIAPRYDLVNRVMTGGLDRRWRRAAVDAIAPGPGDRVLDLACGTGDLLALCTERGARAVGVDFAYEMLARGRGRAPSAPRVQGDAARLPLRDGAVSALVCGFALRNFVSLDDAFAEMARVVAPGGRIALLDADRPDGRLLRAGHGLYFDRVVPRIGALLSDRAAYAYLPQSTAYLPPRETLREMLGKAGFGDARWRHFLFGSAQLIVAGRDAGESR